MSGGQLTAVLIVAIVMFATIFKARYSQRHNPAQSGVDRAENAKLREEVKALKERLAVLERITVEKENSLEREIERLRDK